jgi:hypothetical protein
MCASDVKSVGASNEIDWEVVCSRWVFNF